MLRSLTRRRLAPVALLAAATMLLAGCGDDKKKDDGDKASSDPTASASSTPALADGSCDFAEGGESAKVKVTGTFGAKDPKADFEKGLKADKLERTVLTTGTG